MDLLDYLMFSFWFVVIHTGVYTFAGRVNLKISEDLYEERDRMLSYTGGFSTGSITGLVLGTFLGGLIYLHSKNNWI
jgi:hypothetical protein